MEDLARVVISSDESFESSIPREKLIAGESFEQGF